MISRGWLLAFLFMCGWSAVSLVALVASGGGDGAVSDDGVSGVTVTKTVIDGTECVVAKSRQGVGVSCDWTQP